MNGSEQSILVNGRSRRLRGTSVEQVLVELGYPEGAPGIAVALNGSVVPRRQWSVAPLAEGDELEIVGAVQGG